MKKVIYIFLILICFDSFLKKVLAECDFQSGNYISQLSNPDSIKDIKINVRNSRKYAINFIKTLVSANSTNDKATIDPSIRKKFTADVVVNYKFGTCKYKGKVRQTGDYKDHIKFEDGGKMLRSIKVKLDDGNILNATKFKLFLPETRNGLNEILGTTILRNLGFITPETFEVLVDVNNVKSKMIFQEDSQKELLERNLRREGPIFESDEKNARDGFLLISLSRLINKQWFLKGETSREISTSSYSKLQEEFLKYSDYLYNNRSYNYKFSPNKSGSDNFADYDFLMLSMNGQHALRFTNRKFYFNSLLNKFEPIYYDGDLQINVKFNNPELIKFYNFSKEYAFPYLKTINKEKFFRKIKKDFKIRLLKYTNNEEKFLTSAYDNFIINTNYIQKNIKQGISYNYPKKDIRLIRESFVKRFNKFGRNRYIFNDFEINDKNVFLILEDNKIVNTDLIGLSRVFAGRKVKDAFYTFLPKNLSANKTNLNFKKIPKLNTEIIYPKKMKIKFENKDSKNRLLIFQTMPTQSVLINGGNLKNTEIIFKGLYNFKNKKTGQRFNYRGLTGCLNIYNVKLKNTSIDVSGGNCEDSLNVVNSIGDINTINIKDAFQDAVDFDFSNINIDKMFISSAGNDCFDISAGNYQLNNSRIDNCQDKGISVGEKSYLYTKKVDISNANIGIAVKDLSTFKSEEININNSQTCLELFKKKQEFGGAYVNLKTLNCKGNNKVDKNSVLNFKINEF